MGAGDHGPAPVREGKRVDVAGLLDGADLLAGGDIPEPEGAVPAAAGREPAVSGHRQRHDLRPVAGKPPQRRLRLQVPKDQGLVVTGGEYPPAVGKERDRVHRPEVLVELGELVLLDEVPHLGGVVEAPAEHGIAVGRHGDGAHHAPVADHIGARGSGPGQQERDKWAAAKPASQTRAWPFGRGPGTPAPANQRSTQGHHRPRHGPRPSARSSSRRRLASH